MNSTKTLLVGFTSHVAKTSFSQPVCPGSQVCHKKSSGVLWKISHFHVIDILNAIQCVFLQFLQENELCVKINRPRFHAE